MINKKYTVVIIGAGPGGLACAKILADNNIDTIVIERKKTIGKKVCAGGITWRGIINRVPRQLLEGVFPIQYLNTTFQSIQIKEENPIIATVNREKLGKFMADEAKTAGAKIIHESIVHEISDNWIKFTHNGVINTINYDFLVGADGSTSKVRKFLKLPTKKLGVGINYQIPGRYKNMEWHLNNMYFNNGYGWIFPHKDTISIGAYVDKEVMKPRILKKELIKWANRHGFPLEKHKAKAEFINYDYRGWNFGNIFLVGDAAGLASGLTGEGIYPAIISGEAVAKTIINPEHIDDKIANLTKKHTIHTQFVKLTSWNKYLSITTSELIAIALKYKIIDFKKMEMAS